MVGIVAYGAHLPWYRLERKTVVQAMGWINPSVWALAGGEKTVANADEDAITLAVAAVRNAARGLGKPAGDGLFLASTTFPYALHQNAAIAREALQIPETAATMDVSGTPRSGTTALLAAWSRVSSGDANTVWVAAADVHPAKMGSGGELLYGDGAAAVAVGTEGVLAELVGSYTLNSDFPDRIRAPEQPFPRGWEERWVRDEGYLRLIPEALRAYLDSAGLSAEEVAAVIYPCPFPREHASIGKRLGFSPNRVVDPLMGEVGDTGSAHPLLMLCRVLESASPGDHILMAGFGSGVDVVHLRATDAVSSFRPARGLDELLSRKARLSPYEKAVAFRELVPVETGLRGEFQAETPLSVIWRERRTILGLVGTRCLRCGTPQFPPQRICAVPECQAVDETEPYRFADRPARVFSYTGDHLAFSLDPPQIYGIVDFQEGGRMMLDFTDCALEDVRVGQPVELHFRKKYHDAQRGVHTYFWKAVPLATQGA